MSRDLRIVSELTTADYNSYDKLMELIKLLNENYGYVAELNFIDGKYGDSELLPIHETLGSQDISYSVDFQYKGSTDSEYKAAARGDFEGKLSEILTESESAYRYDGRLCLSLNIPRTNILGYVMEAEDTGTQFAMTYGLTGGRGFRLYWNNDGSTDYIEKDSFLSTGGGEVTTVNGSSYQTFINVLAPANATGEGNTLKTSNNDNQLKSLFSLLEFNIPMFYSNEDAAEYVQTGNLEKCLNNPQPFVEKFWYAINEIYKSGTSSSSLYKRMGYKWDIGKKKIAFYKSDKATGSYNLKLKTNAIEIKQQEYDFDAESFRSTWKTVSALPETRYLDGDASPWVGVLDTNIPIYDSEEDAERYLNDEDSRPKKKRPGEKNPTGTDLRKTNLNEDSFSNYFTTFYVMDDTNVRNLAEWLYDEDNITLIKNSPMLWGNDPIQLIIDTYWTPLDVESLCGRWSAVVKFAQINTYVRAYRATETVSYEYTVMDELILGTYGDWRDKVYLKFKLYLPYYGAVELDSRATVGHRIKVSFKYYLASKTIKYYLYNDGVQIATYESSVGASFSITALDFVGKANEKWSGLVNSARSYIGMRSGLNSVKSGVFGTVTNAMSGDISGALSASGQIDSGGSQIFDSMVSFIDAKRDLDRDPAIEITGNYAVDGACNDCTKVYLVIEEDLHEMPEKLHDIYNYQCYIMDVIGNYKGFVMATDIHINCDLTEPEVVELISIIQNGIIIS